MQTNPYRQEAEGVGNRGSDYRGQEETFGSDAVYYI